MARLNPAPIMSQIKTLDYQQAPAKESHSIARALKHRNYRLFFGGQLISLIGTFLTQTATLWFVYRLTHSYKLMGTIAFLGQLPVFILTPFAGVVADRVHRRRFIVWTQFLSMLQSLGLAALAFYFGRGEHPNMQVLIPGLIGLAAFQGIVNAFDLPARQAFMVEIVTDRADLPNAIALNSTMVHGARMIGPAAAGLIIAVAGESLCFFLDGISYIAVIIALLAMTIVPVPPRQRGSVRAEMLEGFKYAWSFTPIRTILIFMALLSLTGMPAVQLLMPVYGDYFGRHIHGSETFGLLGTVSGIGALVGAVLLAARKSVLGLGRLIGTAVGVFGLAVLCFAYSRHLWLSLAIIPFAGWGMITAFASSNTIIQTLVDDDKRGRVMSLFGLAFLGMAPFGSLIAGFVSSELVPANGDKLIGASRTLVIAAAITLTATIAYFTQLPAVRKAARPIYIKKGILPEMATALQAADEATGAD
jgi:MFS family permease